LFMSRFRTASLLAAGVLVTTWVSAPAAPTAPPPEVSAEDMKHIDAMAPIAAEIDQQVEQLRVNMTAAPQKPDPGRDPFAFGARRPAPRPAVLQAEPEPTPAPVVELPPAVLWPTLAAVMAEASGHTAVVAWGDTVEFVKAGDGYKDFRVVSVSAASIELRHEATGTRRTISLR
jgi:Tfp pilus assembly protein PilP